MLWLVRCVLKDGLGSYTELAYYVKRRAPVDLRVRGGIAAATRPPHGDGASNAVEAMRAVGSVGEAAAACFTLVETARRMDVLRHMDLLGSARKKQVFLQYDVRKASSLGYVS